MSLLITAIILTKNEEKNIVNCIKSLSFCDEILIIDDNSIDATRKSINNLSNKKIKIISHFLNGNFSQSRNFGIQNSQNDWILFVDADEIVSDALAYEITNVITLKDQNLRNFNGFYVKRLDYVWGKTLKYGEAGGIRLLRLGRKGYGQWHGKAHETWKIEGAIGNLKNPILHFPHQTISEFLKEINLYSDIRTAELKSNNSKVFFLAIALYPLGKFLVNYLIKRGFMDGMQGLVYAILMSFHSFLVRVKLWLMWDKK